MKYAGMPSFMWMIFSKSFRTRLINDLGYDESRAYSITKNAKNKYKEIITKLPSFEKGDIFLSNIVNASMFISFLSCMDRRPDVEEATKFYRNSMSTPAMKWFCRKGGKVKFSDKDIAKMKRTAALKAADRNPYSWSMDYLPYADNSGYEARFYKCGICTLMKEYGFFDLTPAMCRLDYTMSEFGGTSTFVREYTLAGGGPYCDCGYIRK